MHCSGKVSLKRIRRDDIPSKKVVSEVSSSIHKKKTDYWTNASMKPADLDDHVMSFTMVANVSTRFSVRS